MRNHRTGFNVIAIAISLTLATSAFAHVRMSPKESAPGGTERYTMRVPTERDSPTIRIEMEVPAQVVVTSIEEAPGWKIEQKKDARGNITAVIWSGGSIPFAEYREMFLTAKNPPLEMTVQWKVIQIYADGTRSEWSGPEDSKTPSPVTMIKKPQPAKP